MRNSPHICSSRRIVSVDQPHRVRVLIVDDYPDNVESLAILLRLYEHEVDTALGGPAALRAAAAQRPDVVVLDLSMPVMDGYHVAARLREMFDDEVGIIALTALGFDENRKRCLEVGFDGYVVKPAEPRKLDELIRNLARSA